MKKYCSPSKGRWNKIFFPKHIAEIVHSNKQLQALPSHYGRIPAVLVLMKQDEKTIRTYTYIGSITSLLGLKNFRTGSEVTSCFNG